MNWLVNFFQAFAARANRFNVAHICICCSCHLYVYPNFNTKLSKWWKVRNRKRKKTDVKRKFPPKTDLQSWWSLSICMQKNRLKYAFQATYSNKMFNRDWKSYLEYFVRRSIFNLLFYKSFEYYFKVLTCAAGDSITKICAEIYEQIGAGHNE